MHSSIEFLKSRLIGTHAEELSKRFRWLLSARERRKHPELWELYLEEFRLPLILQRLLGENSCGVDVGCHLGSFLALLTELAPNGRHIAFEPIAYKSTWLKE